MLVGCIIHQVIGRSPILLCCSNPKWIPLEVPMGFGWRPWGLSQLLPHINVISLETEECIGQELHPFIPASTISEGIFLMSESLELIVLHWKLYNKWRVDWNIWVSLNLSCIVVDLSTYLYSVYWYTSPWLVLLHKCPPIFGNGVGHGLDFPIPFTIKFGLLCNFPSCKRLVILLMSQRCHTWLSLSSWVALYLENPWPIL